MSMFLAWVVFPLVLGALSLGLGLLVEGLAGIRLRGALLLPTGFAAMIVIAAFATAWSATARMAVPAVVVLAAVGLLISVRRLRGPVNGWPILSALGVYGVFAAPVVLAGRATFAGYIKLDDGAWWLAMTDHVMTHGRSLAGLSHSSYQVTLQYELSTSGYPIGSFLPLGVGHALVRQDSAWLFQPYMAFMAAALALVVYSLVSRVVASRALRAVASFAAAQAALYLGFALWGGVKEIAAAPLIALVAALAPLRETGGVPIRGVLPPAVAVAATMAVLSVGGAVWVAPILLLAVALGIRSRGTRFAVGRAATFAGQAAVLSIPTLLIARAFIHWERTLSTLTKNDLVNLLRPLKLVQVFGIWPAGDFRVNPHPLGLTYFLVAIAALAACGGIFQAWRRRAPELIFYSVGAVVALAALVIPGSPWVDAKALATASPAFVIAAAVGACALIEEGVGLIGVAALVALVGGILWSNVLQYHDVWLAPRAQLAELETIGNRYKGDGPALMTEFSPYGVRHFLHGLAPEAAGEFRYRPIPLLDGQLLAKGAYADIDDFQTSAVLVYRTLVLRTSPTASRPPSVYRLVWRGRFYEVWQRPATGAPRILEHLPLGNSADPGAIPSCSQVRNLAALAGPSGRLAAVERPPVRLDDLAMLPHPSAWAGDPSVSGAVVPSGAGTVEAAVTTSASGRYGFWLGGSFRDRLTVEVDSRRIFSGRQQLNWPGNYTPVGEAVLPPGRHRVAIRYHGPDVLPGSGGKQFGFGPLAVAHTTAGDTRVTFRSPADAASLCGKRLDWIEAISP